MIMMVINNNNNKAIKSSSFSSSPNDHNQYDNNQDDNEDEETNSSEENVQKFIITNLSSSLSYKEKRIKCQRLKFRNNNNKPPKAQQQSPLLSPIRFDLRSIPFPVRRLLVKAIRFIFLVILMVTVIINILFIIDAHGRIQRQKQQSNNDFRDNNNRSSALNNENFENSGEQQQRINNGRIIKVEIVSSRNRVMVVIDGTIILDNPEENKNRGIHILVLNQWIGSVMAVRYFDTYSSHEDEAMSLFISMVSDGRILIFAIKDEGTFQLKKTSRDLLSRLGSRLASQLGWRDMWAMVVRKRLIFDNLSFNDSPLPQLIGEAYSKASNFSSWATPAILRVEIELSSLELNSKDDCFKWSPTMSPPSSFLLSPSNFWDRFLEKFWKFDAQTTAAVTTEVSIFDDLNVSMSNSVFLPDDPQTQQRRRHFCSRIEGYGSVCACHDPLPLRFVANFDPLAAISQVPIAIIASNRPHYLYRMLRTLLLTPGCNPAMITVFIDGYYEEPLEVAKLFGLRGIQHTPIGWRNSRISQHYKASLTATFNLYPEAKFIIILEEDLDVAPDFFFYFAQTMSLLQDDSTLFCVSAWNDQAYEHTASDSGLLYRVETMPGLGWMLTRKLYKEELEAKWPTPDKFWDWDMWMRSQDVRKYRECIVPDVPRTYHFGSSGLNMNGFFHVQYFKKHAFNTDPSSRLDNVNSLKKNNYERLINKLIRKSVIIDHKKVNPCDSSFAKFFSSPTNSSYYSIANSNSYHSYLIFIRMLYERDFYSWLQMAKCLHIWDLDARGYHRGMWRLHFNGAHLIVIGVPYSPYSVFKPPQIVPFTFTVTNKARGEY